MKKMLLAATTVLALGAALPAFADSDGGDWVFPNVTATSQPAQQQTAPQQQQPVTGHTSAYTLQTQPQPQAPIYGAGGNG